MQISSPKIKKFQEGNFQARKIKKHTLVFKEMEVFSPKRKKLLYFF